MAADHGDYVQPEEVRDLLDIVRWMFRQERNDILSTPGKLTELPEAKKRRLEHLLDVDRQVKAMLDRLPPHPPMSDEQMKKVGAVVSAALRKRFGEGTAEDLGAAVDAAWPDLEAKHFGRKASSPTKRVQVGWMNPATGVVCDCPVYETSPHANNVPIYREVAGG